MMLTEQQCDNVLSLVLEHKSFWIPRGYHEYGSLHTLGGVSAFGDKKAYLEFVSLGNKLLSDSLHDVYTDIQQTISEYTEHRVKYDSRLAFPGFQIFTCLKAGGDREKNGGIIHKDYLWSDREVKDITGIEKVDEEYSATIMLSKELGQLDIWDNHPDGKRTIEYNRGEITPHNHQLMHQVPYIDNVGESRISMQIRGFRVGDTITLYL